MFHPVEHLRTKLKKECKKLVGFEIFDVAWDDVRNCLCIYELNKRGVRVVREELRHPPTEPAAQKKFEYEATVPVIENGELVGMTVEQRVTDVPLEPEDPDYEEKVLGLPRQIVEDDVYRALDAVRYKEQMSKEILEKLKQQEEQRKKDQESLRESYIHEAAKDLSKAIWELRTGKNAFVDLGAHNEGYSAEKSSEGFTVNDRRRVK